MNDFFKVVGVIITVALVVFVSAVLGGTILFFIWPYAIPAAFPALVASGVLAGKLSWGVAVCLVWVFAILIKSSNTTNNSK